MLINYEAENTSTNSFDKRAKELRHLGLTGRQAYFRQGFFGQTSTIAVVDTGVNPDHAELKGRVVDVLNYVGYGNGHDDNGHGTHVTGTVAGTNVGVAPEAKILSVKVLDGGGSGKLENIIKALEEIKDWKDKNGRRLTAVSMSLSSPARVLDEEERKRFEKAIRELTEADIAVICSAGNTGREEVRYPAYFSDPITVGAVDADTLKPAGFSTESKEVDVCQVGVKVLSAWYEGGYRILSGTSMSTPVVSGIAALIADKFYQMFKQQIPEMVLYWMLKINTKDIGVKGLDPKTGAGFCTLQPMEVDLYTRIGDRHMTNLGQKIQLRAPIEVVPPGVTSLPAREFVENVFGGVVEWDEETKFARFRV